MANSKKRVKAGWKKAKPRRTCCKASPASRNCTNSSGNNEGAKEQKLARGLLWAASCRSSSSGAGHCEERKTHFCTFIAQHLLCTDILRPASFLQPPKPPLILDPNSHIKSDGGVGYTGGRGGRDRGTLLRACGRGERAFNKPTLLFRAQIK